MKTSKIAVICGLSMFLCAGCTQNDILETYISETSDAEESGQVEESTSEQQVSIVIETEEETTGETETGETDTTTDSEVSQKEIILREAEKPIVTVNGEINIPDLVLPEIKDGKWTDFYPIDMPFTVPFDAELNAECNFENFAYVACKDYEIEKAINDKVTQYALNHFYERYQLLDVRFDFTCKLLYESRFLSYITCGTIYHIGGDARYEPEVPYRHYFNFDRMTGILLNLETAYGVERARQDVLNGNYEIVEKNADVQNTLSNENLQFLYFDNPLFEEDTSHSYDFFYQDGFVNICIFVGEDNGRYLVLKLKGEPKIK